MPQSPDDELAHDLGVTRQEIQTAVTYGLDHNIPMYRRDDLEHKLVFTRVGREYVTVRLLRAQLEADPPQHKDTRP